MADERITVTITFRGEDGRKVLDTNATPELLELLAEELLLVTRPSWKNTMNSQLKWWGDMWIMEEAALNAGYPFFEWNGQVHRVGKVVLSKPVCLTRDL